MTQSKACIVLSWHCSPCLFACSTCSYMRPNPHGRKLAWTTLVYWFIWTKAIHPTHCRSCKFPPVWVGPESTWWNIKVRPPHNKATQAFALNEPTCQCFPNSLHLLAHLAVNMECIIVGESLTTSLEFVISNAFFLPFLCTFWKILHVRWSNPCLIIWPLKCGIIIKSLAST